MSWQTLANPLWLFEPDDPFAKFHYEFATKSPPKELFHYTTGESLLAILNSQCMLATERSYLNDPREYRWGADAVISALTQRSADFPSGFVDQAILALSEKSEDTFRIFVLSLSENPDLLSQWRAYAGEGSGFSIGFDGAVLRDRAGFGETVLREINLDELPEDAVFCYHLLPVIYDESMQIKVIHDFLDAAHQFWLGIEEHLEPADRMFEILFRHRAKEVLMSFKGPGYKEECEWRIVATEHKNSKRIKFRNGRFGIAPFVKVNLSERSQIHSDSLPITSLKGGPKCPEKLNPLGLEMLCESKKMQIQLGFSEIQYRS